MKRAKRSCVVGSSSSPTRRSGASGQSSSGGGRRSHHGLSSSTQVPCTTEGTTTTATTTSTTSFPPTTVENSNVFWLKWNTKSDHFSAELSKLFGCGEGLMGLTDVTLCSSDGHFIQAHKLVLSMCSPFFRRIFLQASKTDKSNNANAIVVLANIKLQHLRYLLQFFYEGEIDVPAAELNEFLKIGEMLKIEGLSGYIKTFSGNTGGGGRQYTATASPSHLYQEEEEEEVHHEDQEEEGEMPVSLLNSYSLNAYDDGPNSPDDASDDDGVSMEEGGGDDDQCSNFSDDEDVVGGRPKRAGKSKTSSKMTNNIVRPSGGIIKRNNGNKMEEWVEIEPLSEEDLQTNWRKRTQHKYADKVVRTYYCAHSTRSATPDCPAKIKRELMLESGAVTFLSNQAEHCNHRDRVFGLTPAQKDFIVKMMMEAGVTAEKEIMKAMEEAGNVQIPNKNQIPDFIKKYRKKMGLGPLGRRKRKEKPPSKPRPTSTKKVKTETPHEGEAPGTSLHTSELTELAKTGISNLPSALLTAPGSAGYPGAGVRPIPVQTTTTTNYQYLHQIQGGGGPRPVYTDRGNPPPGTLDFAHFGLFNMSSNM